MNDKNTQEIPGSSSFGKKIGIGCGTILILLLAFFAFLHTSARNSLNDRVAQLKKDIAKHRARDVSRPVLFGTAKDGNAVWDYNAVEWMISARSDWDEGSPPQLPQTHYPKNHFKTVKPDISLQPGRLIRSLQDNPATESEWNAQQKIQQQKTTNKNRNKKKSLRKLSKKEFAKKAKEAASKKREFDVALAFHKKHARHLIKHVQAGLQRKECNWEYQFEKGASAPLFNLLAARNVADMMAYEAHLSSPSKGNELGLQTVAYAQDLEQHPTLIGKMIAIAIKAIGFQSLERTLRRPLSEVDLKRSIAVLQTFEHADIKKMVEEERLTFGVTFAQLGGISIGDEPVGEDQNSISVTGDKNDLREVLLRMKIPLHLEWNAYEKYYSRYQKALELPITQQESAMIKVDEELENSHTFVARIATPNVFEAEKHANEINIMGDLVLIGAAAKLHRLKTGKWPSKTSELAPYLKNKVPLDIHTDKKKEYSLVASGLDLRISCAPPPYDGSRQLIIRVRAVK